MVKQAKRKKPLVPSVKSTAFTGPCERCKRRKKKCIYSPDSLVCKDCKSGNPEHACIPVDPSKRQHLPAPPTVPRSAPDSPDSELAPDSARHYAPCTEPNAARKPGRPSRKAKRAVQTKLAMIPEVES